MARQGADSRTTRAGATVSALVLDHDWLSCPAHDHWNWRSLDDRHARPSRTFLRRVLLSRRRAGALLALCRYRLDLPAADVVPAGNAYAMTEHEKPSSVRGI